MRSLLRLLSDLQHGVVRTDLVIDLQGHVLARLALRDAFVLDLEGIHFLREIGPMAMEMEGVADADRPRQFQDGDADTVEIVGDFADRLFRRRGLPKKIFMRTFFAPRDPPAAGSPIFSAPAPETSSPP